MTGPGRPRTHGPQLVTLAEAADIAGVTPRTVRNWVGAGIIVGYRSGPRSLRVDAREVVEIDERKREAWRVRRSYRRDPDREARLSASARAAFELTAIAHTEAVLRLLAEGPPILPECADRIAIAARRRAVYRAAGEEPGHPRQSGRR